MTSFMQQLIISLLSSTAVAGLSIWLFKTLMETAIKSHFDRRLDAIRHDLDTDAKARQEVFRDKFDAFRELISLIYRARSLARDLEKSVAVREALSVRAEFEEVNGQYAAKLGHNRAWLKGDRWTRVHTLKHNLDAFNVFLLMWVNDESERADIDYHLRTIFKKIERGHSEAIADLQKDIPL